MFSANEQIILEELRRSGSDYETRIELVMRLAKAIDEYCPNDEMCRCWKAGYEKALEAEREPLGI